MKMNASIRRLELEPAGQDFSVFYVEAGRIVQVEPEQGWAWRGKQLSAVEFAAGDELRLKDGPLLNYRVSAVSVVRPSMTYESWLARVDYLGRRAADIDNYSAETGANRRGDPWIKWYLRGVSPDEAFARNPVPEFA